MEPVIALDEGALNIARLTSTRVNMLILACLMTREEANRQEILTYLSSYHTVSSHEQLIDTLETFRREGMVMQSSVRDIQGNNPWIITPFGRAAFKNMKIFSDEMHILLVYRRADSVLKNFPAAQELRILRELTDHKLSELEPKGGEEDLAQERVQEDSR